MTRKAAYQWAAAGLLLLMGIDRLVAARRPADVSRYHADVRAAAGLVPHRIGGWVGQDVRVPEQAMSLLSPNVILSRQFTNVENGMAASVLLVHCVDAHDLLGHFPPRCFPGQGWTLRASRPKDWTAGDLSLTGTEYEFVKPHAFGGTGGESAIVVANCLLRPGGRTLRDMDELSRTAGGARAPRAGAGQIQVYFGADVPEKWRDAAVGELAIGYRPALDAILAEPGR